jgi:CheY-like chemotaxis protein
MPAKKVLVIDDEESITTYLSTILDDHGYDVLTAIDAEEGARLARDEKPDLICMDIMMPKRSGLNLYQEFKLDADLKSTPVMFISAFNRVRDLRDPQAFRRMITNPEVPQPEWCMEKPIRIAEFVEVVERLLAGETSLTPPPVGPGSR